MALVAKSRCLNGDFGFGLTAVGTFEVPAVAEPPPLMRLLPPPPDVIGRGTSPLRAGCVCTMPCVAEKKLPASRGAGASAACDRHQEADVVWSDLSDAPGETNTRWGIVSGGTEIDL